MKISSRLVSLGGRHSAAARVAGGDARGETTGDRRDGAHLRVPGLGPVQHEQRRPRGRRGRVVRRRPHRAVQCRSAVQG
eukprot:31269-Pelagococcus_subviridis.AAC.6